MSIDPKGTAPGTNPEAKPAEPTVNMKCRRDKCPGMTAFVVPGSDQRLFRCTVCDRTWGVNVGGPFMY